MTATPADPVAADTVARVRAFNRYYTRVIGLLDAGLAGSDHSLVESRVLYELAHADGPLEVTELRRRLDLDAGYLSRILARFTAAGLVARDPSPDDGRRQVARLTAAGRAEFADLDRAQVEVVRRLLAPLTTDQRAALVAGMDEVEETLRSAPRAGDQGAVRRARSWLLRPPAPGELGWVVARHGAVYAAEHGWNADFEAMVAGIVADYARAHDPAREAGWIAEVDGVPAGSVFCVASREEPATAPTTAVLRLLLVEPSARGLGIGARLVDECLRFASAAGYARITLWTVSRLHPARAIYQRAGFTLDSEEPQHSFGHDVVGQTWSRSL